MHPKSLPIFQVDAFAREVFQGNPAAVVPLEEWLPDTLLQAIAAENNLSETAYFVRRADHYHLRWFTPNKEVRLCGHATLASAHVLFTELGFTADTLRFHTLAGELRVSKQDIGYTLDFPSDPPYPIDPIPLLDKALGITPHYIGQGSDDLLVQLDSAEQVERMTPDLSLIAQLPARGLIVTAAGRDTAIISRCFYPAYGVPEDPVTGSAHTVLTPYWANLLGSLSFSAQQGSARKGYLHCSLEGDRVRLAGEAITYLTGSILLG